MWIFPGLPGDDYQTRFFFNLRQRPRPQISIARRHPGRGPLYACRSVSARHKKYLEKVAEPPMFWCLTTVFFVQKVRYESTCLHFTCILHPFQHLLKMYVCVFICSYLVWFCWVQFSTKIEHLGSCPDAWEMVEHLAWFLSKCMFHGLTSLMRKDLHASCVGL